MTAVVYLAGVLVAIGATHVITRRGYEDRIKELEHDLAISREFARGLRDRALRAPFRLLPKPAPRTLDPAPESPTLVEEWPDPDPEDRITGTFERFDPEPLRPLDEIADGDGTEAPCVPPRASDAEATTVAPIPIGSSGTPRPQVVPFDRTRREPNRLSNALFGGGAA